MAETVAQKALAYLATHQVMTLATVGPLGVWAAAVFYVNDGFDLYFLSAGHTRHAKDMTSEPNVAATIQEDYKDWPSIKGIQLEGRVVKLSGQAQDKGVALYLQKYPFMAQANPQITAALQKVNWYQITPSALYFIDNSKGLGHRDQIIPLTDPFAR